MGFFSESRHDCRRACYWCRRKFQPLRNDQHYCSGTCRTQAGRKRIDGRFKGQRKHSAQEWHDVLEVWGWKCFYCGTELHMWNATKDHMTPVSRGGSDVIENIVPACRPCNLAKGTQTAEEFRAQRETRGGLTNLKRLFPLVVAVLLLAGIASAQTITAIQPGVCVKISNCVLYDVNGSTVWSDVTWNTTTSAWGGFLQYGIYPNQQVFTTLRAYPVQDPVDPNPADSNNIIYSVEFQDQNSGTTYTEVLKGYSYYYRGSGGRAGGGSGTRYAVTSGVLTIAPAL